MYKVTIGLEVHCELQSNSKVFSPAVNGYSEAPNSLVAYQDLGFPGILPIANKEAVKRALKVSMALNCKTPDEIIFDRKNYYYPDLPKGYQITQMTKPVGIDGYLDIDVDGEIKRVDIHDIHLEEDTASLDHYDSYSLIDYNRSGIPLIETVTEPCMHSKEEALTFLETLRSLIVYCGVSEARSDKGQMRCDVNVSLSKTEELGSKVEIKNINSFYNVGRAIDFEIQRQTEILNAGGTIEQETRRFDELTAKGVSVDALDALSLAIDAGTPKCANVVLLGAAARYLGIDKEIWVDIIKTTNKKGCYIMSNEWWKKAVVYEIYCKSFSDSDGDGIGDLKGITSKLDYLKELGITCIWFSPLYCSPNADFGYDISDYKNIHPDYGTLEQFQKVLDRAHELGLKVLLDLVINHTSDEHTWFIESCNGKDNPYSDYYIWRDPLGVEKEFVLENGLKVFKNKVPLGVISMIS